MNFKTYELFLMHGYLLCSKKDGLLTLPREHPYNLFSVSEKEIRDYAVKAVIWSGKKSFTNKSYTVVYRYNFPHFHNDSKLPELPEDYSWIPVEKFREGSYGASDMRTQILPDHYNKIRRMLNDIEALK